MNRIWKIVLACALACFTTGALTAPASAAECDIAILNGRVMDPETMLDAARNVCVKDGKIDRITEEDIQGDGPHPYARPELCGLRS